MHFNPIQSPPEFEHTLKGFVTEAVEKRDKKTASNFIVLNKIKKVGSCK